MSDPTDATRENTATETEERADEVDDIETDASETRSEGIDAPPDDDPEPGPADDARMGPSVFGHDLSTALQGGALAVAVLFALIAAVGFYASAQRVIDVWVAGPYRPVFTMGFNLVVLLAMVGVVAELTRRLAR